MVGSYGKWLGKQNRKKLWHDATQKNMNHTYIPYGRQQIGADDIQAVVDVLQSDWLTTGPKVSEFEKAVADFTGAVYAVAVSSGTAALHAAMFAIGVGPGDEVIVPAITFVATANSVVYQGGTPVFADVQPDTLLIDPDDVRQKITNRTKAIIAVDYAGQPCDYERLQKIADEHNLHLIADSCHAIGAEYRGRKVGTLAELTIFSFHPVKHITTGEGGMVVTDNPELAESMRQFRNHGISSDHRQRESQATFHYDMEGLGYNYRISDVQCALGISQLKKLPGWLTRRREIAKRYDVLLADSFNVKPLSSHQDIMHAYHLYVVKLSDIIERDTVFQHMREKNIGVNVHYQPVYLHSYYQQYGYESGLCPVAEKVYGSILSLPMYAEITDQQVEHVARVINAAVN